MALLLTCTVTLVVFVFIANGNASQESSNTVNTAFSVISFFSLGDLNPFKKAKEDPFLPNLNSVQFNNTSKIKIAYSPYHGAFNPITGPHPTEKDVRHDLELLQGITNHIRIYSTTGISYDIVKIAHELKIKVDLGLEVGQDSLRNQQEIDNAIKIVNDFSYTINSVVVANDVFLMEKISDVELIKIISDLREKIPGTLLTVANPPEGWFGHEDVIKHIDYVMIQSYPFWWGQGIPASSGWIYSEINIMKNFVHSINPKAWVVVGETGFPSNGKIICDAVPNMENQSEYFRELVKVSKETDTDIIFFEIFNSEWKHDSLEAIEYISKKCGKKSSGTEESEANFGIFTEDGKLKQPLVPFFIPIASYAESLITSSEDVISIHTNDFKYADNNDVSYLQIDSNSTESISIDIQKDGNTSTIDTALPHTIITSANQNVKIAINNPENHTLDIMQYGLPEIFAVCESGCTLLEKSTEPTDQFLSLDTSNGFDEYLLPIIFWTGIVFLAISLLGYYYLQNRRMQHAQ